MEAFYARARAERPGLTATFRLRMEKRGDGLGYSPVYEARHLVFLAGFSEIGISGWSVPVHIEIPGGGTYIDYDLWLYRDSDGSVLAVRDSDLPY